jgi:hypothetical protein
VDLFLESPKDIMTKIDAINCANKLSQTECFGGKLVSIYSGIPFETIKLLGIIENNRFSPS